MRGGDPIECTYLRALISVQVGGLLHVADWKLGLLSPQLKVRAHQLTPVRPEFQQTNVPAQPHRRPGATVSWSYGSRSL